MIDIDDYDDLKVGNSPTFQNGYITLKTNSQNEIDNVLRYSRGFNKQYKDGSFFCIDIDEKLFIDIYLSLSGRRYSYDELGEMFDNFVDYHNVIYSIDEIYNRYEIVSGKAILKNPSKEEKIYIDFHAVKKNIKPGVYVVDIKSEYNEIEVAFEQSRNGIKTYSEEVFKLFEFGDEVFLEIGTMPTKEANNASADIAKECIKNGGEVSGVIKYIAWNKFDIKYIH